MLASACVAQYGKADSDSNAETVADSEVDSDSDAGIPCNENARLAVTNESAGELRYLYLCEGGTCAVFLDGLGVDTGEVWSLGVCEGEDLVASVHDDDAKCAVSPPFSLTTGQEFAWSVDVMTGTTADSAPYGCDSP